MSKWLDALGAIGSQFQIGIGGTGLRRLRFRNGFNGDLEWTPTANRTLTLPDATGTIALVGQDLGARVYHNTTQSLPHNTLTVLQFNSERYDTDSIHDPVNNTDRLTCNTAGIYLIGGHVAFASSSLGMRQIQLRVNGTDTIAIERHAPITTTMSIGISTVYSLDVGDYVQLLAFQDSGMALNVVSGANYSPEFFMQKL